jgi:GrpB-like predicted nucleotidyltransferase (UPF0157 family)
VDQITEEMNELGYEAKGENGIAQRRYFQKGGDARTHHIHCFPKGHAEVKRHLCFRDYLLVHQEKAQQYSTLKQMLATRFDDDRNAYIAGKEPFILQLDKEAEQWFSHK